MNTSDQKLAEPTDVPEVNLSGGEVEGGGKFWKRVSEGSRRQVWNGTADRTSGGLTKSDLTRNKRGKVVSKRAHAIGVKRFEEGKSWRKKSKRRSPLVRESKRVERRASEEKRIRARREARRLA